VALTANAVAGQADIFMGNGFDDFISKPIDVRQLNAVLNKLIRDKQPPEVLEKAKQHMSNQPAGTVPPQPTADPHFVEIFLRDANKSVAVISSIIENNSYNEADVRSYTIHTHGMRSALANIGKLELSATAFTLEQSGRNGSVETIKSETPAFLSAMKALIKELTPDDKASAAGIPDGDKAYLIKMLHGIKAACDVFDEKTADDVLSDLRDKLWAKDIKKQLDEMSALLLHSEFDDITALAEKMLNAM
jgi:HPt (histidine-containing phosphotransfer) domain-containing protein